MLFGAVGAAGFGMFFNGTLLEIVMSFFIGILIRCISCFLSKHKLNSFLNNAISAGSAALSAQLIHQALPQTNVDIMVISSFMLLVPGLADYQCSSVIRLQEIMFLVSQERLMPFCVLLPLR